MLRDWTLARGNTGPACLRTGWKRTCAISAPSRPTWRRWPTGSKNAASKPWPWKRREFTGLRSYMRYRDELVAARSTQCQHLQKALQQMNVCLHHVLSDVTGVSGLAIIEAILDGQRDPVKLAAMVHRRVRASQEMIQKALMGDYRAEHLFVLKVAFDLHHTYAEKILACEEQIVLETARLPDRVDLAVKPLPDRKEGRPAGK